MVLPTASVHEAFVEILFPLGTNVEEGKKMDQFQCTCAAHVLPLNPNPADAVRARGAPLKRQSAPNHLIETRCRTRPDSPTRRDRVAGPVAQAGAGAYLHPWPRTRFFLPHHFAPHHHHQGSFSPNQLSPSPTPPLSIATVGYRHSPRNNGHHSWKEDSEFEDHGHRFVAAKSGENPSHLPLTRCLSLQEPNPNPNLSSSCRSRGRAALRAPRAPLSPPPSTRTMSPTRRTKARRTRPRTPSRSRPQSLPSDESQSPAPRP